MQKREILSSFLGLVSNLLALRVTRTPRAHGPPHMPLDSVRLALIAALLSPLFPLSDSSPSSSHYYSRNMFSEGDQLSVNYTRRIIRNLDMNIGADLGFDPKNKAWSSMLKFVLIILFEHL